MRKTLILLLITFLALSFASCKDELEQRAELIEQRWYPTENCDCQELCFYEYIDLSNGMFCKKDPSFELDEDIDCFGIRLSTVQDYYLGEGSFSFTVLDVSKNNIIFETSGQPTCTFKGTR